MNTELFYWFNGLAGINSVLDWIFRFLANDFGLLVVFILGLFLLEHKDKNRGKREAAMVVAAAALAWIVAHFLKDIFHTARPFLALQDAHQLLSHEADGAFPSGHATFYSSLAMMMYFYHKRIAYALAVVSLIVGISRVISGVHWPIDILGGYVLGIMVSIVMYFLVQKFWPKK